jgi:di/tricarboxylate transporter
LLKYQTILLAAELGLNPQQLSQLATTLASSAHATPTASPAVTLVVAPGNYKFMDFVKVGTPMFILTWLVYLALTPPVFPPR